MATHRYTRFDNGLPLLQCVECGADLTEGGEGVVVEVEAKDTEKRTRKPTYLTSDGVVVDPERDLFKRSFHMATYCAECGELLADISNEDDIQDKTPNT